MVFLHVLLVCCKFAISKVTIITQFGSIHYKTRMHSSRMRTGRSLTVCWGRGSVCSRGGVCSRGCLLLGGCLLPGGVCFRGCLLWGVSAPRGCLLWGGVCSGVSAPGGLLLGGCLLPGGVVSQHALRQTPPCEQNHTPE